MAATKSVITYTFLQIIAFNNFLLNNVDLKSCMMLIFKLIATQSLALDQSTKLMLLVLHKIYSRDMIQNKTICHQSGKSKKE